jgi:hypothetical protein
MPEKNKVDRFVELAMYAEKMEFDPEQPEVSNIFLGMSLKAMEVELDKDGLLQVAADRLKDAREKVHQAGTGGPDIHSSNSEGG